jgi:hypothetical protein
MARPDHGQPWVSRNSDVRWATPRHCQAHRPCCCLPDPARRQQLAREHARLGAAVVAILPYSRRCSASPSARAIPPAHDLAIRIISA